MGSLHLCNDQEGGPRLKVDLTTWIDHQNPKTIPNVLESYDNVCTCINIPKYIQDTSKWSIDNHGNGFFAYFEPDCKNTIWHSQALYIKPGLWWDSEQMNKHTKTYRGITCKIQSFGPDVNSRYFAQSCSSHHHDQIMKLELLEALNSSSSQPDAVLNETRIDWTTGANDDVLHFFADGDFQGKLLNKTIVHQIMSYFQTSWVIMFSLWVPSQIYFMFYFPLRLSIWEQIDLNMQ